MTHETLDAALGWVLALLLGSLVLAALSVAAFVAFVVLYPW